MCLALSTRRVAQALPLRELLLTSKEIQRRWDKGSEEKFLHG